MTPPLDFSILPIALSPIPTENLIVNSTCTMTTAISAEGKKGALERNTEKKGEMGKG
jgi:hypothetical protein